MRLHGIKDARIGDLIGDGCIPDGIGASIFPPPALESAVHPVDSGQMIKLGIALQHLTEQDPLIGLRNGDREGELFLRLFGEVQKEVIAETLALDFGIVVHFAESQVLHIERPLGTGRAFELIGSDENPFAATVGIRIERAEPASGIRYAYEPGSLPHAFYRATEETVMETLEQGLHGWPVTDCLVTLTDVGYWSPISIASDFRLLTPLVVMQALQEAGTEVCEPVESFTLDIPAETIGETLSALVASAGDCRRHLATRGDVPSGRHDPVGGGALLRATSTRHQPRAGRLGLDIQGIRTGNRHDSGANQDRPQSAEPETLSGRVRAIVITDMHKDRFLQANRSLCERGGGVRVSVIR